MWGASNPMARLTQDEVDQIREKAAQGLSQRCIAKLFSVSQSRVSYIVSGKSWPEHPNKKQGETNHDKEEENCQEAYEAQ